MASWCYCDATILTGILFAIVIHIPHAVHLIDLVGVRWKPIIWYRSLADKILISLVQVSHMISELCWICCFFTGWFRLWPIYFECDGILFLLNALYHSSSFRYCDKICRLSFIVHYQLYFSTPVPLLQHYYSVNSKLISTSDWCNAACSY